MAIVFAIWFLASAFTETFIGPDVPLKEASRETGREVQVLADKLVAEQIEQGEDPEENEKIEKALLENGYLSDAVPLAYDLQDIARTACEKYRVPYALVLAVIERESKFVEDAVGIDGRDHGLMQIRDRNFDWLREATGEDPTEPAGNLVCGIYMLGDLLGKYGDGTDKGMHKALMAYKMGPSGAASEWEKGRYKINYSIGVLEAMERWASLV